MANVYADESMSQLEDIEKVVARAADRLGIDKAVALENALKFADTVGTLENDGKLQGGNVPQAGQEQSSAKGLYQFLDGSVEPALNRLGRSIGEQDWMKDAKGHKDANQLNWSQQTQLFLADVLDKTAVVNGKKVPGMGDDLMRRVLTNADDTDAVRDAYYILHHTKPDEATKKRTERILYGTQN